MFVHYDCVLTRKRLHLAQPSVVCQQVKLVSQKNPNILIMAQISSSFSKSSIFRVERAAQWASTQKSSGLAQFKSYTMILSVFCCQINKSGRVYRYVQSS